MKYEYQLLFGLWDAAFMNKQGQEGWKLVSVHFNGKWKDGDGWEYVFMREIQ